MDFITPTANTAWDKFIGLLNVSVPHPHDQNRFYDFIAACHAGSEAVESSDLEAALRENGMRDDQARRYSQEYATARNVLGNRRFGGTGPAPF